MTYEQFYNRVAELNQEWKDGADPIWVLNMIQCAGVDVEAAEQSEQRTECKHDVGEWVAPFTFHCTVCGATIQRR